MILYRPQQPAIPKIELSRVSVGVRAYTLAVLLVTVALGGCGNLIDDSRAQKVVPTEKPGTSLEVDDWSCVVDERGLWDCNELNPEPAYVPTLPDVPPYKAKSESLTEPASEPEPIPEPEPESESDPVVETSTNAFVLQLAAHRTLEKATTALSQLDDPNAKIVKTQGTKGALFLIIAGSYPDRSAAKAAAAAFQTRNYGADYWIRDASGVVEVP
jgi:cell division septation protein DedD